MKETLINKTQNIFIFYMFRVMTIQWPSNTTSPDLGATSSNMVKRFFPISTMQIVSSSLDIKRNWILFTYVIDIQYIFKRTLYPQLPNLWSVNYTITQKSYLLIISMHLFLMGNVRSMNFLKVVSSYMYILKLIWPKGETVMVICLCSAPVMDPKVGWDNPCFRKYSAIKFIEKKYLLFRRWYNLLWLFFKSTYQ